MEWYWQRSVRRSADPELLAGVLFGTLCVATLVLALKATAWQPACVLFSHTGIACPTCGSYRALSHLLAGHFATAVRLQPLAILGGIATFVFVAYSWVVVVFRLPRLRVRGVSGRQRAALLLAAAALVLTNWLYVALALASRAR